MYLKDFRIEGDCAQVYESFVKIWLHHCFSGLTRVGIGCSGGMLVLCPFTCFIKRTCLVDAVLFDESGQALIHCCPTWVQLMSL